MLIPDIYTGDNGLTALSFVSRSYIALQFEILKNRSSNVLDSAA